MTWMCRWAAVWVLAFYGCSDGGGGQGDADGADTATDSDAADTHVEPDIPPVGEAWPVGIPYPEFGVEQSVESVYGDGFYTYWVDNTGACDDGGPSTEASPRCTIPFDLEAGDVVYVAAGTYELGSSVWIDVAGTLEAPIFLRGPEGGPRPVLTNGGDGGLRFDFTASYLIIENLEFRETRVLVEDSDHVALRSNHIHSSPDRTCVAVQGTEHVILGNEIDHCQDNNRLGVAGSCGARMVWVVGNHIHHNAEDSIQFGHGCESDPPQYLYFGFNVMHSDRENAVDLKWVRDVVVSQNEMYGYRPAPTDEEFCYDDGSGCYPPGFHDSGSDGSAMVLGSDGTSRDIWVLLNEIHDSQNGIRNEETSLSVLMGNLIHGITGNGIVCEKSAENLHILSNALHGMQTGIDQSVQPDFVLHIVDNIFSGMSAEAILIEAAGVANGSEMMSNLFWQDGAPISIRWGSRYDISTAGDFDTITEGSVSLNEVGDPAFTDPSSGDFMPGSGSAAIDAGTGEVVEWVCGEFTTRYGLEIQVDFDGVERPHGAAWDIGPYEQ